MIPEDTTLAKIIREVMELSSGPFYASGNETQRKRATQGAVEEFSRACDRNGVVIEITKQGKGEAS